jgi:hypothetical protein
MSTLARAHVAAVAVAALLAASVSVAAAAPGPGKSGRSEAETSSTCGGVVKTRLRLRAEDGTVRLEFRVEYARGVAGWRVALVHERRVAWKGPKSTRRAGSFVVRRELPDLPGSDTFVARIWGPGGRTCTTTATVG